ncbi:MAG: RNA polymerase sigma factor FliA [Planctomycetes bacterium]|nr:RNA polymerase sigma factor FliA [Planctomycetota bacterium]
MTTEAEKKSSGAADALKARASQAYSRQTREMQEEKWIIDHLPLVRHIVNKLTSQLMCKVELDDLISAGTLGLVKAARAYDQSMEAEFKTYAYIRVSGAVIDEIRRRSFVPSAVHNQIQNIQWVYRKFAAENGRPPGDEELAEAVGVPLDQLYKTFEAARRQHFLSIHGMSDEQAVLGPLAPLDEGVNPADQVEQSEMLERLTSAIQELPERDRVILLLYYERDLTMKETAKVLGVTESRVSQLHAAAIFKLSMKLKGTE